MCHKRSHITYADIASSEFDVVSLQLHGKDPWFMITSQQLCLQTCQKSLTCPDQIMIINLPPASTWIFLGWILETESSPSLLAPYVWNEVPTEVTIRCSFRLETKRVTSGTPKKLGCRHYSLVQRPIHSKLWLTVADKAKGAVSHENGAAAGHSRSLAFQCHFKLMWCIWWRENFKKCLCKIRRRKSKLPTLYLFWLETHKFAAQFIVLA